MGKGEGRELREGVEEMGVEGGRGREGRSREGVGRRGRVRWRGEKNNINLEEETREWMKEEDRIMV